YFRRVREICRRHGVLLILDEVMCGMGRTGTLHACEQEGVSPDLMVVAKGLGGGYAPIGALMMQETIFHALAKGSGAFQHTHTYMGHPLACAAALAVQRVIRRDNLLANVRAQGTHLSRRLKERFGNHPFVGDVRGRGLLQGVELVADRGTKEAFDPKLKIHARVKREAMARGLMVYPMGGTVDGVRGDHVLIAPPFIVNDHAVEVIVERLGEALDASTKQIGRESIRAHQLRRKLMRHSIGVGMAATVFLGGPAPAATQHLGGTLKKVRESGVISIGHRDSSIPLSYLDDKLQPVGFSIELCKHVVEAVK